MHLISRRKGKWKNRTTGLSSTGCIRTDCSSSSSDDRRKKEWLLSLYNAVNHSHHTNAEDITFTTLDNVIYVNMKNDLSFLIGNVMSFYEHQSTYNPNLPLRMLFYLSKVYENYVFDPERDISLYSSIIQNIPAPKLICFYNGTRDIGESMNLKLSDMMTGGTVSDVEVNVLMLNINQGRNRELLSSCGPLSEYSLFTSNVRQYFQQYRDMDQAVGMAIEKLPEDSGIRALLEANRAEVRDMCLTEYDAERENKILKKQYLEAGADRMGTLMTKLKELGREDDAFKAAADPTYREKLFKELGIA